MNFVKIKPLEAFHFLRQKKIPKIVEKEYCLLSDSFFDIGIAYFQDRKPVRKTYFPLGYQKEEREKFIDGLYDNFIQIFSFFLTN